MISFDSVAAEVFQILRSYDYTVKMYDAEGNQVYEPEEARRMFASPENLFVSLVEDGENSSIRLYLSKSTEIGDVQGLMDTLRSTATKYNMIINTRETGKEIEPADFATSASVSEHKEEEPMSDIILEGMYGTTRSSYLKLENARMIVRHSKRVNEDQVGGRSRNIDAIFVEDASGQRFLFPTRQLAPARAMTQHVNHGGNFADQVGQQIGRMAQDYSSLSMASNFVGSNSMALPESAQNIRENCRRTMKEMRRCFERLSRESGYVAESQRLAEAPQTALTEGDDLLAEEIRATLYVEGREIDEAMILVVAEAVRKCQCEDAAALEGATSGVGMTDDNGEMTNVLGRPVSKPAWDKLKAGQLELISPMTDNMGSLSDGQFRGTRAKLSYLMGQLVPLVANDSMSNMLAYANQQYQETGAAGPRMLVIQALRSAGALDGEVSSTSESVREFSEWMAQTSPSAVLAEKDEEDTDFDHDAMIDGRDFDHDRAMDGLNPFDDDDAEELDESNPEDPTSFAFGRREQEGEDAAEQISQDFNVDAFLADCAEDLDYDNEDRQYSAKFLKRLVKSYLEKRVREDYGVDMDMSDYVDDIGVWDAVKDKITSDGYTLTEKLTRQNVLIPTNQGEDLRREVTDPEAGAGDIDRMRALAGLQGR